MATSRSRRDFMKTSAAVSSAWWVGASALADDTQPRSANEELQFACIGVAGKGSSDTDDAGRHGQVVALCDVDKRSLKKKSLRYPEAKTYSDFREMLDELEGKVDGVTVSTPDHTHAPAASMALKKGMNVYCQKPLTWSVHEARHLRNLAAETGLCTQMGNQGTAVTRLREGVEVIRSGALGDVTEVHVWTNRPIWPQGKGRPTETPPTPPYLDWDLFLGPAPERPYHPAYHPFKWRGWLDFGTGALGDMACHTANMPVMALNLFDPISFVAESEGLVEGESYPKDCKITFQFPERTGVDGSTLPACKLYWYDGGRKPDADMILGEDAGKKKTLKVSNSGSLTVGSEGRLYSPHDYGGIWELLPLAKFEDYKMPEQSLPRSPGHFTELANAIREGKPDLAMSNFAYGGRLTETILLGNLSLRAGEPVEWDSENLRSTNSSAANDLVAREYRDGWTL
ncbi:Gfo/Idh/MocA family protein [Stratiformator vulcanicus]|uniref:Putative oxidoreductase n=1 Tax=Stratiformator vulcanicus TaxID=2527980 RepID=A0A517QYD1_9PLAN|nr:Gfo/Idh/MocA family oxidoreductase [Stratiformator vulcanicus]QDT36604.1 putative oxidoreductase [Stratiformator vulcanicus]